MVDFNKEIKDYIQKEIELLSQMDVDVIESTITVLLSAQNHDNNIYCIGNGGSASTASHFQNDFNKGLSEYASKKFNFLCLSDNIATITAIANDVGYEEIYRYQLRGKVKENDIIVAISGSGNSKNIINAVTYAKQYKAIIIGLTGFDGGELKKLSDISLHVPINNMQITEDLHLMFNHLMMYVIKQYYLKKFDF